MKIEIDPDLIQITGDPLRVEYDGAVIREYVCPDSLIATCPSLRGLIVQSLIDAMSAHDRLEFFSKKGVRI